MGGNDLSMKGKVSQAWIYRCLTCSDKRVMESLGGRVTQGRATLWVREEGWSKTREGWKCRACKGRKARVA